MQCDVNATLEIKLQLIRPQFARALRVIEFINFYLNHTALMRGTNNFKQNDK